MWWLMSDQCVPGSFLAGPCACMVRQARWAFKITFYVHTTSLVEGQSSGEELHRYVAIKYHIVVHIRQGLPPAGLIFSVYGYCI